MDDATKRSLEAIHELILNLESRLSYLEKMRDPFRNSTPPKNIEVDEVEE